jgi:hypothetical protein
MVRGSVFFNPNTTPGTLNWLQFTVPYTATGASTKLAFFNGTPNGGDDSNLDNVTFTSAHMPAPLPLLGAAAAFSWRRTLRKRIMTRRTLSCPGSTTSEAKAHRPQRLRSAQHQHLGGVAELAGQADAAARALHRCAA